MRISDWSSDVCSSDLLVIAHHLITLRRCQRRAGRIAHSFIDYAKLIPGEGILLVARDSGFQHLFGFRKVAVILRCDPRMTQQRGDKRLIACRSEERRVGEECVSTGRSRWSPEHLKKNKTNTHKTNN